MLEIEITQSDKDKAKEEFNKLKNKINSAFPGNELHGFLGEILFKKLYNNSDFGTYEYDLLLNNYKIEVKTRVLDKLYGDIYCNVFLNTKVQLTDYYVFIAIMRDLSKAYLLGAISKEDMIENSEIKRKGDVYSNKTICKTDSYFFNSKMLKPLKIMRGYNGQA